MEEISSRLGEKMVKVSVIVPVYNVEKYFAECIDSILTQNFNFIEIICVEDGSTDNSMEILEEYAKKDNRIKIIKHGENKGLSAARNTGLKCAVGQYVLFVDSDDVLAPNAIRRLYDEAEDKNSDIVYFDYEKIYDSVLGKDLQTKQFCSDGIYTGKEFFCEMVKRGNFCGTAWSQFFNRQFLSDVEIQFYDGIYHEDVLFSFRVAMEAKRVVSLNEKLYFYRQREQSIMRTKNYKREQSVFIILMEIMVYWKEHSFTKDESTCIGKFWEELYQCYLLYKSYGEGEKELLFGDDIDKTIYRILHKAMDKKWLNVDEIQLDQVRKYEQVLVYGAGQAARQVVNHLSENGIGVSGIVTTNPSDNPTEFCGVRVCGIDECTKPKDNIAIIIAITSKFSGGIEETLREAGFRNIISLPDATEKVGGL